MSIARAAARNVSSQGLSFLVTIAERLVLVGILIRSWGAPMYSDWATLSALAGLLVISEFGFQIYLGNVLSRAETRGRPRAFQRAVGAGIFFYLCLGAGLMMIAGIILPFVDLHAWLNLVEIRDAAPLFLLLAAVVVLRVTRNAITQIFRAKGDVHRLIMVDPRTLGASFVLGAAATLAGGGPVLVAALYLACELLLGVLYPTLEVRRRYPGVALRPEIPKRSEIRDAGSNLRWYGWLSLSNQAMSHVPVLVIAWLGLTGPLLISFVVQRTLINVSRTLTNAFAVALGIEVSRARDQGDQAAYLAGVRLLARFNTAFAAITAGALFSLGPALIALWTGRSDLFTPDILVWLVAPVVAIAPAIPLQMLTLFGRVPKPQALASFVQVALGLPAAVLCGLWLGAAGVALGMGVGEVVGIGILLPWLAAPRLGIAYGTIVRECAAVFGGALLWCWGIGWAVVKALNVDGAVDFGIALAIWGVFGALPVTLASLPRAQRDRLLAFTRDIAYRLLPPPHRKH